MTLFKDQHARMVTLAEAILVAASSASSDGCMRLTKLRIDFARAIVGHRKEEKPHVDRAVAQGLISSEYVSEFESAVLQWRSDVMLCNANWTPARIVGDPNGFTKAFQPIVETLRQEIRREERDILVHIKEPTKFAA